MIIEAGEYLPDQPDFGNPGAIVAKNCYPVKNSYRPLKELAVYSSALAERPLGSFPAKATDGNTSMFVGTASYLYSLGTDLAFDNVSIAGNYSGCESWAFTQYGDTVIAASLASNLQSFVLGTSTLFGNLTADLKAEHIASSELFVMVGNTYDTSDGSVPHRIRWSAIDDPTDWTVAAATQSDFQDLNSTYGEVTGIKYVGDFYVFQDSAISRVSYVGSPTVFDVDTFETSKGTHYGNSIANSGSLIFFLAEDGFYMMQHSQVYPIGSDKVNETFYNDLANEYAGRIKATVDPVNNLVLWAYASNDSAGKLDKLLIYNWVNQKWSFCDHYILTHIGTNISLGYTLEDLDTIGTDIDAFAVSLDSDIWKGGLKTFMVINSDWKICLLTGDTIAATVDTREAQPLEGRRACVDRVRPIVDGSATVQVGTRTSLSDAVTWSSAYSAESNGDIPVRENDRFMRFRIITSGDYNHIQGVELLEIADAGTR